MPRFLLKCLEYSQNKIYFLKIQKDQHCMGHQCPTLLRLEVRSEASASPIDIREMIEIDKKKSITPD